MVPAQARIYQLSRNGWNEQLIFEIWPGISTPIDSCNATWGESHIGDVVQGPTFKHLVKFSLIVSHKLIKNLLSLQLQFQFYIFKVLRQYPKFKLKSRDQPPCPLAPCLQERKVKFELKKFEENSGHRLLLEANRPCCQKTSRCHQTKKGKNISYVEESLTRITDFGNLEDNRLEVLCKDATHNVESHVGQQQSIPWNGTLKSLQCTAVCAVALNVGRPIHNNETIMRLYNNWQKYR